MKLTLLGLVFLTHNTCANVQLQFLSFWCPPLSKCPKIDFYYELISNSAILSSNLTFFEWTGESIVEFPHFFIETVENDPINLNITVWSCNNDSAVSFQEKILPNISYTTNGVSLKGTYCILEYKVNSSASSYDCPSTVYCDYFIPFLVSTILLVASLVGISLATFCAVRKFNQIKKPTATATPLATPYPSRSPPGNSFYCDVSTEESQQESSEPTYTEPYQPADYLTPRSSQMRSKAIQL